MTGVFIFLHVVACVVLITVILMQSGRGGGLTEGFAPAESLFGAKTNQFMVRATVIFASLFLVTCLTLAYLSSQANKSVVDKLGEQVEQQATEAPQAGLPSVPMNAVSNDM